MLDLFQPWVLATYGDSAKTKTITLRKAYRIQGRLSHARQTEIIKEIWLVLRHNQSCLLSSPDFEPPHSGSAQVGGEAGAGLRLGASRERGGQVPAVGEEQRLGSDQAGGAPAHGAGGGPGGPGAPGDSSPLCPHRDRQGESGRQQSPVRKCYHPNFRVLLVVADNI